MDIFLGIIIALVIIFYFWYVSIIGKRNKGQEALSGIDVQLKKRSNLIPNILNDVSNVDLSTKVFGKKIDFPLFLAPASMHRLYHHDGEKASSKAAEKFNTIFSMRI